LRNKSPACAFFIFWLPFDNGVDIPGCLQPPLSPVSLSWLTPIGMPSVRRPYYDLDNIFNLRHGLFSVTFSMRQRAAVKPGSSVALPLLPEFIRNEDGTEKPLQMKRGLRA
jgi:hypothetical protein